MKELIDNFPGGAHPAWVNCRGIFFARGGPKLGGGQPPAARAGGGCPSAPSASCSLPSFPGNLATGHLATGQPGLPNFISTFQPAISGSLIFIYHISKTHRYKRWWCTGGAQSRTNTPTPTPTHLGDTTGIDNNNAALPFFLRPGTGMYGWTLTLLCHVAHGLFNFFFSCFFFSWLKNVQAA